MPIIGRQLPDIYFAYSQHAGIRHLRIRQCLDCGHQYVTAEIPLYAQWSEEVESTKCPNHPEGEAGRIISNTSPHVADKGKKYSVGMASAYRMGGVWRRRECLVEGCVDAKNKKKSRWSTAEVSAEGMIVENIMKCPRCKGQTRVAKRKVAVLRRV